MSHLSFEPDQQRAWMIIPCIDGRYLDELVYEYELAAGFDSPGGYAGFKPELDVQNVGLSAEDLARSDAAFGRTGDDSLRILECTCGTDGCWPFLCRATVSNSVVRWDDFRQPRRTAREYSGFGPFTFELEQYAQALRSVLKSGTAKGGER